MKLFGLIVVIFGLCLVNALPVEDSKLIRPNTPENLARLANPQPDDIAEMFSGQFEGDILMTDDELIQRNSRTGLIDTRYRWLNFEVPYFIETQYFNAEQIAYIDKAAHDLEAVTCLRLVRRDIHHSDYITIRGNNDGCYSSVGRRGGAQVLNLTPNNPESGCFRLYTIIHEFLHALGFYHMQSASERDDFVEIVWANIQAGTENNFAKHEATRVSNFNVLYDYGSVMHYPAVAFSINGQPTILKLNESDEVMGQRVRLSEKDIARVNAMYCQHL